MNIYYISPMLDFTKNNASVFRVLNVCSLLRMELNVAVTIIGKSTQYPQCEVDGIRTYNLVHGTGNISKIIFLLTYPIRLLWMIKSMKKPDVIITYNMYGISLFLLQRYCHRYNIKIIGDVVEWYEYSLLKNKMRIPGIHWTMVRLNKSFDGIIAISSYLQDYYQAYVRTLFLPPIFRENYFRRSVCHNDIFDPSYLNLIYAGVSGKKDLLNNVILSVNNLVQEGKRVRLHIIGATKLDLEHMYSICLNDAWIMCYGPMNHDELLPYLLNADFTVILRDADLRYAKAGFSSKFVESLCCGLPIIANISGDMGQYLINGYNGYIVSDYSIEALTAVIKQVIEIPKTDYRITMRNNANKTFIDNFCLDVYKEPTVKFFDAILN